MSPSLPSGAPPWDLREAYSKIGGVCHCHFVFHGRRHFFNSCHPFSSLDGKTKNICPLSEVDRIAKALPSLALFAVPLIVLEPVKPAAVYLIGAGQMAIGVTVLTTREILKLVIVERLFKLCRRKLMKIPLFAWGYGHWRQGADWLVSLKASKAARRWTLTVRLRLRNFLIQMKRSYKYRRLFAQPR